MGTTSATPAEQIASEAGVRDSGPAQLEQAETTAGMETSAAPAGQAPAPAAAPADTAASYQNSPIYQQNLEAMIAILRRGFKRPGQERVGLELERILVDEQGRRVMFSDGPNGPGVHSVLEALVADRAGAVPSRVDGHLLGLSYRYQAPDETFDVVISLEPGAQMEVSAGPVARTENLLAALEDFDAELARVTATLGRRAHLVGRGYDLTAAQPEDVELIPKDRYYLMDDYLPRHGQFARDMMRCSGSTQVSVDYENETEAMVLEKVATVLGPVFCFAFDNAPVWRAKPAPHMVRGRIWRVLDPERCGFIPGSLDADFSFERYCAWLAAVHPILMTDRDGVTTSAGTKTSGDLMAERPLTTGELNHLASMVWPTLRLKGYLELREMDSLPPAMAVACASFMSALFYDARLADELPVDVFSQTEESVMAARLDLEGRGWDAEPYGMPVGALVDRLVELAVAHARTDFDLRSIALLARIWADRRLPRDVDYAELCALRA